MPENKFENQVHKLMDELTFTPSEEVWPAIKNRIQRKRKRRFFFFLLSAITALLVTGYFIFNKNKMGHDLKVETVHAPAKITATENENIINLPVDIQKIENENADQSSKERTLPTSPEQNDNPVALQENDNVIKMGNQKSSLLVIETEIADSDDLPIDVNVDDNDVLIINDVENNIRNNENFKKAVDLIHRDKNAVKIVDHSINKEVEKKLRENIMDAALLKLDSAIVINEKKSSKWKLGFHLAAGFSKTGSNAIPGISGYVAMDFYASPSTGGPLYIRPAQKAKAGISIGAGFVLQKQLTDRSSISTGLQYFYANDRLLAGTHYDTTIRLQYANSSSVRSYYSGNNAWYTNQYHFLELPIQYGYLLNKNSILPIRLHAGIIFSQLISTNALVYDPGLTGIYFHDKKQFNKSALSISSGVSFAFNQNKKLKWSVGPQVRAGVTSLRKSSYDLNKYLLSGGFQLKLFID